jgi:hypothetical protein
VGENHFLGALYIIPEWWGVILAKKDDYDTTNLFNIRDAQLNVCQEASAVAQLLWRKEAIDLLESIGKAKGVRSKNRQIIFNRLSSEMNLEALLQAVRNTLLSRSDWRAGQLQLQCGD